MFYQQGKIKCSPIFRPLVNKYKLYKAISFTSRHTYPFRQPMPYIFCISDRRRQPFPDQDDR